LRLFSSLCRGDTFVALCFVFKVIQGLGAGIVETVGVAILFRVVPQKDIGKYFGIAEVFTGLGYS
jgi:MFS family permease